VLGCGNSAVSVVMKVVGPVRVNADVPSPHAILAVPESTVRVLSIHCFAAVVRGST